MAPTLAMSAVKMGMQSAQQRAALGNQNEEIKAAQAAEQRERQSRLKRALSTQRARFGAQGISGGDSSEASLRGLIKEAENDASESSERASLRMNRMRSQAEWSQRRSLLQLGSPLGRSGAGLIQGGLGRISLFDS
jgi:hypothetical protein